MYVSELPELLSQWDYEKNEKSPDKVTHGSKYRAWWVCTEHPVKVSYPSTVNNKYHGRGCPYCSGDLPVVGVNDLQTTDPELAEELKYPEQAKEVSRGSEKVLEWVCRECKREWKRAVYARAVRGHGCLSCARKKSTRSTLYETSPELFSELKDKDESLGNMSNEPKDWVCSECGHQWVAYVYNRSKGTRCPKCSKTLNKVSYAEESIFKVVADIFPDAIQSSRKIIPPKELDIYIPSKNIAIEFNGIYWHSEEKSGMDYHRNKTLLCQEKGIRLIHIWEDDYARNPELVHRMLKHKLGFSTGKRVFARKTQTREIDTQTIKKFLGENHIQGYTSGSIKLGLFFEEELVAVVSFSRTGSTLRLERYATSCHVIGGQSKLLKWVDNNVEYTDMITFADLTVSDGTLYEKTGWVMDKELSPDYSYVYKGERHHKFGFRLKRFRTDPTLLWAEGLTEKQLAELNGLTRIWDCGKLRYRRLNPNN